MNSANIYFMKAKNKQMAKNSFIALIGIVLIVFAAIKITNFYNAVKTTFEIPNPYSSDNKELVLEAFKPELLLLIANNIDKNARLNEINKENDITVNSYDTIYSCMDFSIENIFSFEKKEEIFKTGYNADIYCKKYDFRIPIKYWLQRNDIGQVRLQWQKLFNEFGFLNSEIDMKKLSNAINSIQHDILIAEQNKRDEIEKKWKTIQHDDSILTEKVRNEKSPITISANELIREYNIDKNVADNKFLNKIIQITANKPHWYTDHGLNELHLEDSKIICGLRPPENDENETVNKSKSINIKCICNGLSSDNLIQLDNCQIISLY